MSYPLIMHINYCEQGQTLARICERAVAWGFDGVEFRRKRIGVDETQASYLDELERAVRSSGLRQVLFGYPGPILTRPDAAARKREVDEAVAFYREVAGRFGVKTVNLLTGTIMNPAPGTGYFEVTRHGSFIATPEQWTWHVEGCRDMADRLRDVDIRFGFETHMNYLHDTVEAVMKLVREIDRPSVGVTFDYGNLVEYPTPQPLEEALAAVGKKLHYVHLKNSTTPRGLTARIATALGEGDINIRQHVRLLMEAGYRGPLCVEAPRAGDREWYARTDALYIRGVLDDLGA